MRDAKPRFTRQDYEFLADTIHDLSYRDLVEPDQLETIAQHFAEALRGTNPAFKAGRFIDRATR